MASPSSAEDEAATARQQQVSSNVSSLAMRYPLTTRAQASHRAPPAPGLRTARAATANVRGGGTIRYARHAWRCSVVVAWVAFCCHGTSHVAKRRLA